jgi:membrane-bound lytic murein transglycosylase D
MSVHAVNMYLAANLLLLLAAIGVACLRGVGGRSIVAIAYRSQLQIAYVLTIAALLLPSLSVVSQRADLLPRNAQIWSGASMRDPTRSSQDTHRIGISVASSAVSAPLYAVRAITAGLFVAGAAAFLIVLFAEATRIRRIIIDAQTIATRRRVRVLSSQTVRVPFSLWIPGMHFILLPADLIVAPADLRMAIQHEAQHHRQLDTRVTYVYQLLRLLFFWNPAVHWLHKSIAELQEFSCDEALIGSRKVSPQAYCSCLLRVAESAVAQRVTSICVSMLGTGAGSTLKRRVEALLMRQASGKRRWPAAVLGGAVLAVMAGTAMAFSSTIQDRRISPEQAQRMLAVAQRGSHFPFVANEPVLAQLNRLLGTPDGRAFVRASLRRMQEHQALITTAIARYGLPAELMAVPLVESGYRNLPPGDNPRHGAGLWMFIEPTARRFGLVIDGDIDERLDVALETDAAMRMLGSLYERFDDWGLALLAYNAGERKVDEAMRATGSRNAWQAVEQGFENDADYLPRVMALALIIKNPASIE